MISKNLTFNVFYFVVCGIIFGFSLQDFDNLLLRDELNIHTLIIQWLKLPAVILILFNILAISYILNIIYDKHRLLYLLILINPFVVLNVLDAYNRFVFTIVALYFFDYLARDNIHRVPLLSILALSIHPFNAPALYYRYLSTFKAFALTLLLFFCIAILSPFIHELLLEYSSKYQLFIKLGGDVASKYEGNMVILEKYSSLSVNSILIRILAFVFPYGFLVDDSVSVLAISIYNLTMVSFILLHLRHNRLLLYIVIFILVSILVGNFAVVQRHFLPIAIFFLSINKRRFRIKINRYYI